MYQRKFVSREVTGRHELLDVEGGSVVDDVRGCLNPFGAHVSRPLLIIRDFRAANEPPIHVLNFQPTAWKLHRQRIRDSGLSGALFSATARLYRQGVSCKEHLVICS